MFKHRLLTIIILIPIIIIAIWYLPMPWFAFLIGIVVIISAWEWSTLMGLQKKISRAVYTLIIISAVVITYYLPIRWVLFSALLAWIWAAFAIVNYAVGRSPLGLQYIFLKGLMGVFALVPSWLAINVIRETLGGPFWLFFAFMLVWATDTGGYLAGKKWGTHSLAKRVSPNKTWEGFLGGIVLSLIVAIIVSLIFHTPPYRIFLICVLAFAVALFAVLGDLLESMLKREIGVKDSGTLLPGHGGILDRVDSIMAALPIFALGSLLLLGS